MVGYMNVCLLGHRDTAKSKLEVATIRICVNLGKYKEAR
jgi:hypothetical protein